MDSKLKNEYLTRQRINVAKARSCTIPPADYKRTRKLKYEVGVVFGRLLISLVPLVDTLNIKVNPALSKHREIIDKWESELKDKGIIPHKQVLIDTLNTYVPQNVSRTDRVDSIPKNLMAHLKARYNGDSCVIDAIELMLVRYTTYDAWSQCWTLHPDDSIKNEVFNPELDNIELFGAPFNVQRSTLYFGTLFPDTDTPFGGIMRMKELVLKIVEDNKEGIRYNIQINPPYVETVLADCVQAVYCLLANNNIFVMFPSWTDNPSYIRMGEIFKHSKTLNRAIDMWTGDTIPHVSSTLFW
jgi:hypothetical protein